MLACTYAFMLTSPTGLQKRSHACKPKLRPRRLCRAGGHGSRFMSTCIAVLVYLSLTHHDLHAFNHTCVVLAVTALHGTMCGFKKPCKTHMLADQATLRLCVAITYLCHWHCHYRYHYHYPPNFMHGSMPTHVYTCICACMYVRIPAHKPHWHAEGIACVQARTPASKSCTSCWPSRLCFMDMVF